MSIQVLCLFLNQIICFLFVFCYWVVWVFFKSVLDTNSLSVHNLKIFSSISQATFSFFSLFLLLHRNFSLMQYQLLIFALLLVILVSYPKILLPRPTSRRFSLCFLLEVLWLKVLHLVFNPLQVTFCERWKIGVQFLSFFFFLHVNVQFSQHYLLKRLSFPHWVCLASLSSNISWLCVWMHFWALESVPLVSKSFFVPASCYFDIL